MIKILLRKRTIFFLLFILIIGLTSTTAFLGYDYIWWLRGSIFFSITTIIGIYIGQITTAYKVRHALETKVDDLLNELAIPKLSRLDDPNLERISFCQFGKKLLALLCEDIDYEAGVIYIFEKSLKPTFIQTYYHYHKSELTLSRDDYKLYDRLCRRDPDDTITVSIKSNDIYNIKYKSNSKLNEKQKLSENFYTRRFKYLKLLPISLLGDYLGYIGLFKEVKSSFFDEILEIVHILSEKTILQEIENKKIDDSMKNFLFRQLILQIILTIRYLDNIHDDLHLLKSFNELSDKILKIIQDCWNFNSCIIKYKNNDIISIVDQCVDINLVKCKLIPRIDQRIENENELQIFEENAGQLFSIEENPGFESAIAIKIQKLNLYFGYLLVTCNRQFTDFEKQMLIILENSKIDDCYFELSKRLNKSI